MKSHVTFLTTPTADTKGTCLLLHFDDKRYLIGNMHEGLQRICTQSGTKLSRMSELILSGKTEWKSVGGILGMILTLAEVVQVIVQSAKDAYKASVEKAKKGALNKGSQEAVSLPSKSTVFAKPTLTIHGGMNLMQTIATARRFVFRKGLPLVVKEYAEGSNAERQWQPTWMDHNIRMWAMPISTESDLPQLEGSTSTSVSSASPLKRNFDNYVGSDDDENIQGSTMSSLGGGMRDQGPESLKGVIADMFNSDWRLDALFETHLAEVQMPAAIFIRNAETKKIEKYSGPMPGGTEPLPDITVLVRRPWPGALVPRLPETKPSPISMSYIFSNHPQRGKFDPEAAIKLGVREGPSFSKLTQGQSVKNSKGETVLPEQVLGKSKPGGGFAMVDLPSPEYVANLVSRPEWKAKEVMLGVEAVVWNLGTDVANDVRLQEFINGLPGLKHIISSPDFCPNYLTMDSSAAAAIRHNRLDPERFDIPLHNNRANALPEALSHCQIAHRRVTIRLEPDVVVETPPVPALLNTAEVIKGLPKDVTVLADKARDQIRAVRNGVDDGTQDLPSPETEIITLGTGSALPSKYRNVSSTLVRVPGIGSYLLDCGENTLGQLSRLYSPEELREVLRDLKMIWISHMHADHHLGTASVIKAWYQENYGSQKSPIDKLGNQAEDAVKMLKEQKMLFVASEPAMIHWLREYSQIEDFGYNKLAALEVYGADDKNPTRLVWNGRPVGFDIESTAINEAMRTATGLSGFAAVNVAHCYGAKAVSLTFPTGFKVSYSGDCRPSNAFTKIGEGSTVLIHEATFDDELHSDAAAKNHSTTSEAIGVGYTMGARRILLTHFSQRYQKLPKLEAVEKWDLRLEDPSEKEGPESAASEATEVFIESKSEAADVAGEPKMPLKPEIRKIKSGPRPTEGTKVAVAFDLMRIKVKDIELQERLTPAFVKLYQQSPDSLDPVVAPLEPDLEQESKRKKARSEKKDARRAAKEEHNKPKNKQSAESLNQSVLGLRQEYMESDTGTASAKEGMEDIERPAQEESSGSRAAGNALPGSGIFRPLRGERRLGGGSAEDLSSGSDVEDGSHEEKKRRSSAKRERRNAKLAQLEELRAKNKMERTGSSGERLHDGNAM